MLDKLKEYNRLNETLFLGLLSILCFFLSIIRMAFANNKVFLFLNWNLFLAFIPWLFSSLLIINPQWQKRSLLVILIMMLWLLFFPNAPYILTDLFHLRHRSSIPVWFDLLLILSFAWTGLLFGFISLWNIEIVLAKRLNHNLIAFLSGILLFIGSFGVYLGRYLRWNSWDIIRGPFAIMYDISDRLINPFSHPGAWGMTFFMGLFLNIIYWSFKLIKHRNISDMNYKN